MAIRVIDDSKLQNIAVAIQDKDGGETMTVDDMPNRIDALPTGGTLIPKTITENGVYNATDDNADGYDVVNVNIPTTMEFVDKDAALVLIDWEGTLLRSYTRDEIMSLIELPNPLDLPNYAYADHEWLVFQEWNWDLADIKDYFLNRPYGNLLVGAIYTTIDGNDHKYYYEPADGRNNNTLICVKKGTVLSYAECQNSKSLRFLSIPKGVSVNDFSYRGCDALEHLNIPKSILNITNNLLNGTSSLKSVSLPKEMNSLNLTSLAALENIFIPESLQKLSISTCSALKKFLIPISATSISRWQYQNNSSVLHIVIKSEPSLANIDAFQNGNSLRKFYVPASNLPFFETETNWSALYSTDTFKAIEDNIELLESLGFDVHEYEEVI